MAIKTRAQLLTSSNSIFASAKPDKILASEHRDYNVDAIDSMGTTDNTYNDAITNEKLANMAGNTVKVNNKAVAGDPIDLSIPTHAILARQAGNMAPLVFVAYQVLARMAGALEVVNLTDLEDLSHSTITANPNGLRQWYMGTVYRSWVALPSIGASQTNQTMFNTTADQFFTGGLSTPQAASPNQFIPNGYCKNGMRIRMIANGIVTHHGSTGIIFRASIFGAVRHTHTSAITSATSAAFQLFVDIIIGVVDNAAGTIQVISTYLVDGKIAEVKRSSVASLNTAQASSLNLTVDTGTSEEIIVGTSSIEIAG